MDSSFLKYLVLAALIAVAVFAVWKSVMNRKKTPEQDLADEIEAEADPGTGTDTDTDEDDEEAYTDEDNEESYTDEESD